MQQQDGGVVVVAAALEFEDGVHESAGGLGGGQVVGESCAGEVDEPVDTERVAVAVAGLGDPVGVEQHLVAGFEGFQDDDRGATVAVRNRQRGRGGQHGEHAASALHLAAGMTGRDHLQDAGVLVEFGQHGGD